MSCEFITQLKKLRKSAPESVDDANSLDPFKAYLHVENEVECNLRMLLRLVNGDLAKCLILVCGSAGDGKSHLVAYLKFTDPENLLEGYSLYNDATESDAPTQAALERMAKKLEPFDDAHYDNPDGTKMIAAINLGTLNNFIQSEYGKDFSKLKEYVELNGILSGYAPASVYQKGSLFQHVSFADYQMFTLSEDGIGTAFLENLLAKVFGRSVNNPFSRAFSSGSSCSYCKRCPIRHNYEFLSHPACQKKVISRIVEIVIKDKALVSTREILNLLYDLIVHPEFNPATFFNETNDVMFLQNYIHCTTPMLLDEYGDSDLLRMMQKHDILKQRSEELDTDAARFHSLENIEETFSNITKETPYSDIQQIANVSVLGSSKPELKKITYRFISRLRSMKEPSLTEEAQGRYHKYISYLYAQNSGEIQELEELYDAVECAVMNWNGQFGSEKICIDDTNEHFWILETLKLQFAPPQSTHSNTKKEITRFAPILSVYLKKDGGSDSETAKINLDYTLFEMICSIQEGYRPTVQDKNHHTDFVSFINQVIEFGSKTSRIFLVSKENPLAPKLSFEKTGFKYKFGVI